MVNRKEELKKVLNFLMEKKEELLNFEEAETFIKNVSEEAEKYGLDLKIKKTEKKPIAKFGKNKNPLFRLHLVFDFSTKETFCFDIFDSKEFYEYEYLSNHKNLIKNIYTEDFINKVIREIELVDLKNQLKNKN